VNYRGIVLALIATSAYNTGFVLEKRALTRLPSIDLREPWRLLRILFTAPSWLLGMLCMAAGLSCQLLVLQVLPISLAQPLQAAGIGVLLLLAWLLLGERAGARDWWRLAAVGASVALLGLSATGRTQASTRADPMPIVVVLGVSLLLAARMFGAVGGRRGRHSRPGSGVSAGLATGLLYGIAGLGLKALSGQTANRGMAGIVAVLPSSPYLYLVIGASGVGMLVFQTALQRFRASVVVPTSNVAGSCYVLVFGTWLFHESLPAEPVALALRGAGIAATVVALVIQPANVPPATAPGRSTIPTTQPEGDTMTLDARLLDILACPVDKGALLYFTEDGTLYNPRLRRLHHIEADVPLMRADQSDGVDPERHLQLLSRAAAGGAVGTIGTPVAEVLAADHL
jgi:uncharacterized protein YbaR (Trm112 family)/drug/metabolite transporter (DMT)-like permease